MTESKSVVMLITALDVGGAEVEMVQAVERLAGRGWTVRVVSMIPGGKLRPRLEQTGILVRDLGMRRGRPSLSSFLRLRRWLREWRPAILHSHMLHANLLARLVRPFTAVPVQISTAQNTYEGSGWRVRAYRWTDRWCDVTTQVSDAGARRYVELGIVPEGKIEVVRNSVDPDRFAPDPAPREPVREELGLGDRFVWIAVGHLTEQKDYATMLAAMDRVRDVEPEAVILAAGEGPKREELLDQARRLGLEDRVRFLGLRRDVPRLLNAADAFLMSSLWEGTPLALLEANACGLPAVATDVGGNGEVVIDGEGGWIVPSDDPAALASAMEKMLRLAGQARREMGLAARVRVLEHYALDGNVDRWERLYERESAKAGR